MIRRPPRSEEHTSELQSPQNLLCRLLLEIGRARSEEHTSELQSPQISYAVFCLKKQHKPVQLNTDIASYRKEVRWCTTPRGVHLAVNWTAQPRGGPTGGLWSSRAFFFLCKRRPPNSSPFPQPAPFQA